MKSMKSRWRFLAINVTLIFLLSAAFSFASAPASVAHADSGSSFTRDISSSGTTSFAASSYGTDELAWPEFAGTDSDQGAAPYNGQIVDRSHSQGTGHGSSASGQQQAKSNPELQFSFDGLNHRQQRLANGGNQFSVEPPDQGMCVGNGFVMESNNDVLQVYSTTGTPLLNGGAAVDLNTFYGYAPAIIRATGVRGPFVTDPSCYFDQPTQRWFQVVLTLDTLANGTNTGTNHIDLAVSQTSDPTGLWTVYRIPVQDNGTDGTPNHNCSLGFCFGDYPHIGADAHGFYITTNEYSFFGPEFKAAQIYAISKAALASGTANIKVTQFDTTGAVNGNPGFTVWPAVTPGNAYETAQGGTEYFLSSDAADESNGTGISKDLIVWALTNTESLNSATPALGLSNKVLTVNPYATPPKANQKPGPFPLGQCLNDSTIATPAGPGCWRFLVASGGPFHEVESSLDSNDTRMQQVTFANGKLWGALDTALTINGVNKAGIEWFIVKPNVDSGSADGKVALQGYLGMANNNLTYPAIGVTDSGRGVIAFTVVGADHYPSPGYAALDAKVGAGNVHVIVEGAGPADGFTSYAAFVGSPPRTRWGDYGAAVVDGHSIWIASEYVGPGNGTACTLAVYVSTGFSCNQTRTSLGNWSTRISELTV
ncbi:MAG TPA: hypothetical protein VF458_03420 [Ktedonobacteraceae bacterium]